MRLYVGNMSYNTTEDTLRERFASYGEVVSVCIMRDRFTNESRGFGFVEMANDIMGERAIGGMNGKDVDGRRLRVNEAVDRARDDGYDRRDFRERDFHGRRDERDFREWRGRRDDYERRGGYGFRDRRDERDFYGRRDERDFREWRGRRDDYERRDGYGFHDRRGGRGGYERREWRDGRDNFERRDRRGSYGGRGSYSSEYASEEY